MCSLAVRWSAPYTWPPRNIVEQREWVFDFYRNLRHGEGMEMCYLSRTRPIRICQPRKKALSLWTDHENWMAMNTGFTRGAISPTALYAPCYVQNQRCTLNLLYSTTCTEVECRHIPKGQPLPILLLSCPGAAGGGAGCRVHPKLGSWFAFPA